MVSSFDLPRVSSVHKTATRRNSTASLDQLIQNNQLIAFVGTGGVGKTSLSLTVAIQAAMQGKKVASITVDPSRRLSQILSLDSPATQGATIDWKEFSGGLDVYYVDAQKTFENFVAKHLPEDLFTRLQKNGIYRQVSKNLRETHNFAALYQMDEIFSRGDYDLIVLDTPPCDQVIDFFEAPHRLQKFFTRGDEGKENSWMSWIQDKGIHLVESFFKKMVGGEFFDEMENFFKVVGNLKDEIHRVSRGFVEKLTSPEAKIVMVFSPAEDKVVEAKFLSRRLEKSQYNVDSFLLNRAYPAQLDFGQKPQLDQDSAEGKLYSYYEKKMEKSYSLMRDLKASEQKDGHHFFVVPEMTMEVETRDQLLEFCRQLQKQMQEV